MQNNFILMTDSYKLSHHKQYPKGTTKIYSYLESRGGVYPKTLFFGLQYYMKKYLEGVRITKEMVDEADSFSKAHFGSDIFNYNGWMTIVNECGGKLPIRIKAVKEGTLVPVSNVLMTIENTHPDCAWLTNHCETLLMKLWAPITIATNSFYCKKTIAAALKESAKDLSSLPFKLHDFGYRGVSSEESAGILGMSHLVNFMGTDTLNGILYANDYYNPSGVFNMYGYSVPASEHSVACSFGKENEGEYFRNMLKSYPTGYVSVVSDTYNVYNFVETMSKENKDEILNREGKVVFRPDSGDPILVNSKLIDILWNVFGGTYVHGYKLLPPQVGIIQGDGIDAEMIQKILDMANAKGFSADNWVFGSGGGLLQKFDRDTQKFAIKASYGEKYERVLYTTMVSHECDVTIVGFPIQKDPVTSAGKKSKAGILKLHKMLHNSFMTISSVDTPKAQFESYNDELELVFEDGEIKREQTFDSVRRIAENYFNYELRE